jgi:EAL domain-containing protein (putative c-di-GMP-specific phosphodiesterase class I)
MGVDLGQGWYYGRPGPPEALAPVAPLYPLAQPA